MRTNPSILKYQLSLKKSLCIVVAALIVHFINVDKMFISGMYDYFDIHDELFPLTRSREGLAHETDNFTQPCEKCWWCRERKWVFGEY